MPPRRLGVTADRSIGPQVNGLRTLAHAVGLDIERYLLAVQKCPQTGLLDGRNMHEYILGSVIRSDEAKAFGCVEEFYDTSLGHGRTPSPVALRVPDPPLRPASGAGFVLAD